MSEIKIPELAESITEGTIAEWLVEKGSYIEKDTPVIELETDKVNVEVNSEYAGVITEIVKTSGTDVSVGDTIAIIDTDAKENTDETNVQENVKVKDVEQTEVEKKEEVEKHNDKSESDELNTKENKVAFEEQLSDFIKRTPSARKQARKLGIDLEEINLKELLLKDDAINNENKTTKDSAPIPEPIKQSESLESRPVERQKMSRRRLTIAKRLVEAQQTSAMLTTFNEVDLTEVMNLRKQRQETFQKQNDIKLGFMSFFTKAVVAALRHFPLLNAEIDGQELVLKKFYDIGIAVSTDEGLVVPVIRDADKQDFASLEKEIKRLGLKARDNDLALSDLAGGTFTITNGGVFGSLLSTPILNTPQVGILGMHTIQKRPIAMPDDTVQIRPMMYIALSYDHRIVDGKEAVQFLIKIKELLEDPYNLLLEG